MTKIIELPTSRREPKQVSPKFMILCGRPKQGKSTIMGALPDALIIDLEHGYDHIGGMVVDVENARDYFTINNLCKKKAAESEDGYAYRYIVIDNSSRLDELCKPYAASLARKTPMFKSFGILKDANNRPIKGPDGKEQYDPEADVTTMPNGAGWRFQREAIEDMINMFKPLCKTLILVCHTKSKYINKNDIELETVDVDLPGKSGTIMFGLADAIGLVSREGNKTYIDFNGGDDSIKAARPDYLSNKKFEVITSDKEGNITVDISKVFPE